MGSQQGQLKMSDHFGHFKLYVFIHVCVYVCVYVSDYALGNWIYRFQTFNIMDNVDLIL